MYAVITTGGKQYKVQPGQTIQIEKLEMAEGAKVEFTNVLMVKNGDQTQIGTPYLSKSKVVGAVVKHAKGEKVLSIKFKRRKHHKKTVGHRQWYTFVKIEEIAA